jgi:hypothetical protein
MFLGSFSLIYPNSIFLNQFNESSTYLMGWLRDYLWLNSSQLINGYNPFGMNLRV